MNRFWTVLLIFVAGTAAGGAVVWAVRGSGGGGSRGAGSSTTATPTTAPGVSATGQELLDRLGAGKSATFHVRYSYGTARAGQAVLEVWHTPDRVRRDLIVISPNEGSSHTEEFLDKGEYVRCLQLSGLGWQCATAPAQAANLGDPVGGAPHDVQGRAVTVTDDTIAGHAVRCYTVAAGPSLVPPATATHPAQFCLSAENVPLRIDGGDGKPVEATNYDFAVPDSVFDRPASAVPG